MSVATTTRHEAGIRRRARRAQKFGSDTVPVRETSPSSSEVIRKPETTKNTSTPMKPPPNGPMSAWNSTTSTTAMARRPSMSGRKPIGGSENAFGGDGRRRRRDQRVDLPEWRARCGLFCQLNSWMPDDSRRDRQ